MAAGSDRERPDRDGEGHPDDVAAFGRDLRMLRLRAGSLTYGAIARTASLSKSIVADAFNGQRLPTERTVHGIVSVLDGDLDEWLARRAELAASRRRGDGRADPQWPDAGAAVASDPSPEPGTAADGSGTARPGPAADGARATGPAPGSGDPDGPDRDGGAVDPAGPPGRPGVPRRVVVLVAAAALVTGAGVTAGATAVLAPGGRRVAQTWTPTRPSTGADVATSGCLADARVVVRLQRPADTLELVRSRRCDASWADAQRSDRDGPMTVGVYRRTGARSVTPDPATSESVTVVGTDEAVTPLLLDRAGGQTCVTLRLETSGAGAATDDPLCG